MPITFKKMLDYDHSKNEIFQTIENLRTEKLKLYQQMNKNDVDGSQIEFKLRHIAELNETEAVRTHIKDIERAAKNLHKLTEKLEKVEELLKNIDMESDEYKKRELMRKREDLIKEFNHASKTEANINKKYPSISTTIEKYLDKEEKEQFEQFLKNKIKLLLKVLNVEKKIQYEINRYKLIDSNKS